MAKLFSRLLLFVNLLALNICFAQLIHEVPSSINYNGDSDKNQTKFYEINNFGFYGITLNARHDDFYYPECPQDFRESNWYEIDAHNVSVSDINLDGFDDVIVYWKPTPHRAIKKYTGSFSVLINNQEGGFELSNDYLLDSSLQEFHHAYKPKTEDFNNDGYPDFVAASMSLLTTPLLEDGSNECSYEFTPDRIPLLLSNGEGKYIDGSNNLEGQSNSERIEGFEFSHEVSTGDINGDGYPDIFSGGYLFLNDGTGNFSNQTDQLPDFLKKPYRGWTSLISDFDNDNIDDIVLFFQEDIGNDVLFQGNVLSGVVYLSDGNESINDRKLVPIPEGLFGKDNTKFNHSISHDINNDGLLDILVSQTRAIPYYGGRGIQILINNGDTFLDQTDLYIPNQGKNLNQNIEGEGNLFIVDVNNDGVQDIVHSGGSGNIPYDYHSIIIYLYKDGRYELIEDDVLPIIDIWQIAKEEQIDWRRENDESNWLSTTFPVNIDNKGWIDFLTFIKQPPSEWPSNTPYKYLFYTINSINDFDKDGVLNENDVCDDTPLGVMVNTDGCEIFSLPADNYSIQTNGVSCSGKTNGIISISVSNTEHIYNLSIPETEGSYSLNSENEHQLVIDELEIGSYTLNFTVEGQEGYLQTFEIGITEPPALSAKSSVNQKGKTMTVKLSGSDLYYAEVNGDRRSYKLDNFTLQLRPGMNTVKISTPQDCQGVHVEQVFISEQVKHYPNPVQEELNLVIPGEDRETTVEIYDRSGKLLKCEENLIPFSRIVTINTTGLRTEIYVVKVNGQTVEQTFKMIKR
ncbi:T9SS type A sorting domain-containing protein [Flavobacteriaceae bacterium]|nr:T9SS type A sorting domain-containing protein [Flavobacteriaceae bacterium]